MPVWLPVSPSMLCAQTEGQHSTLVCDDAQDPPKSHVFLDTRHVDNNKPGWPRGCRVAARAPHSATPVPSSVTPQQNGKSYMQQTKTGKQTNHESENVTLWIPRLRPKVASQISVLHSLKQLHVVSLTRVGQRLRKPAHQSERSKGLPLREQVQKTTRPSGGTGAFCLRSRRKVKLPGKERVHTWRRKSSHLCWKQLGRSLALLAGHLAEVPVDAEQVGGASWLEATVRYRM